MTTGKTQTGLADERTDLAHERTVMASDRTLMAWTRTSLSMISFGFSVFKFMETMQEQGRNVIKGGHGAQNFGMTLIALGIVCLVIACLQYWQFEKKLNPDRKWYLNLTFMSAAVIALIGLLSLINGLFNIGPF